MSIFFAALLLISQNVPLSQPDQIREASALLVERAKANNDADEPARSDEKPTVWETILYDSIKLTVGFAFGLFTQRVVHSRQSKDRKMGLANACVIQIRETRRIIENYRGGGVYVPHAHILGTHTSSLPRIEAPIMECIKWLSVEVGEKAQRAWWAYRDFTAEGCRDAAGDDGESTWARFENQKAESVKERVLRLLAELEATLK